MTDLINDRSYDVIVIGAGPAGENAADYAHQHGLTAIVVEKELVGGECSYWGCMPSKALLRPTEVLAHASRVPAAAAAITGAVDVAKVLKNRDAFTSDWDDSSQVQWLNNMGVELIRGHGRVAGEKRVEVAHADGTTTTLRAHVGVVIGIGTRSATPPIDGLAETVTWGNRELTEMQAIPDRLLVMGGGVIGVEMAQAVKRLGASEVTIIEGMDTILGREEPAASKDVHDALVREGIVIRTGQFASKVSREGTDGAVTVTLVDGTELVGDELLVSVGRSAPTGDLGLETVGVEPGRGGYIGVDGHLRVLVGGTPSEWLYAVGDVNGRSLLTHQGKYQARLVGDRLAGIDTDEAWADEQAVPRVVFSDPQLAAVGLTEAQARKAGLDVRVVSYNTGWTAGAALFGKDAGGTGMLVIDQSRRVIVGATFVGAAVAELLHSATIAIVGEVSVARLWHAVPSFPTISEVWLRLLEEDRKLELAG
jgi:pyruvate/2-oxoglutarate dehydrogenase complex dihydrolipoamide dehydrogenase (E3) component